MCCFLATGFPTQYTSYSPRSPPPSPWHAPRGLCKPLLLPVLAVCSCDAASSWGSRGWGWLATFALCHTVPLWLYLNLHCKSVRTPYKGTCCRPLEEVCRGGTALDIGLHAIRPQIYLWLVSIKDVCQLILIGLFLFLGPEVVFEFRFRHALYLKILKG